MAPRPRTACLRTAACVLARDRRSSKRLRPPPGLNWTRRRPRRDDWFRREHSAPRPARVIPSPRSGSSGPTRRRDRLRPDPSAALAPRELVNAGSAAEVARVFCTAARQPCFRRGAGLSRQSGRRPARRQLQARRSEERVPDFDPRWGRASVPQRARHSRPCQEVTTTAVGRSGRSTAARPGVAEAGGDPDSLPVRTSWESAPTTSAGACSARRSRDTADRSGATAFSCKQPRFDAGGAAAGCCCRTTWAANSTASS